MGDSEKLSTASKHGSGPIHQRPGRDRQRLPTFLKDKQYLLYSEAASCYALNRSASESNIILSCKTHTMDSYDKLNPTPTSHSCVKGLVFSPYREVIRSSHSVTSSVENTQQRSRSNDALQQAVALNSSASGTNESIKGHRGGFKRRLGAWLACSESQAAWTCLLRVSLCQILLGINFLLPSVLYMEYAATFSAPQAAIGWVPSLQKTAALFVAMFLSPPLELYGCRPIAVMSACLLFLGNGLAAMAPGVVTLYVTQGLLAGIGTGALEMVSGVLIQQHFSDNRALAAGLSTMGLSVGNVLGPVIFRRLTSQFGWRGGLLITSALMAHALPLALTYRPPTQMSVHCRAVSKEELFVKASQVQRRRPHQQCTRVCRGLFDCSLLRHFLFGCFCVSSFCRMFGQVAYIFLLPSRAVHGGMGKNAASLLVAILAGGNFVTRVALSVLANLRGANRLLLYGVGGAVGGLSAVLTPLCARFPGLAIMAALQGVSLGMTNTIAAVVMVDCVGVGRLPRAYGLYGAFCGVAALISTPFAGWLYDISNRYDIPFVAMGVVALLGGAMVCMAWFWNRHGTKESQRGATVSERQIMLEDKAEQT